MRLLAVLALSLGFCSVALAEGTIICPIALTCNYDAGKCDMPPGQWVLDSGGASEPFSGTQMLNISKIGGLGDAASTYELRCYYNYGSNSTISLYTYVQSLTGENWVYSGFGQSQANCTMPSQPETCTGVKNNIKQ